MSGKRPNSAATSAAQRSRTAGAPQDDAEMAAAAAALEQAQPQATSPLELRVQALRTAVETATHGLNNDAELSASGREKVANAMLDVLEAYANAQPLGVAFPNVPATQGPDAGDPYFPHVTPEIASWMQELRLALCQPTSTAPRKRVAELAERLFGFPAVTDTAASVQLGKQYMTAFDAMRKDVQATLTALGQSTSDPDAAAHLDLVTRVTRALGEMDQAMSLNPPPAGTNKGLAALVSLQAIRRAVGEYALRPALAALAQATWVLMPCQTSKETGSGLYVPVDMSAADKAGVRCMLRVCETSDPLFNPYYDGKKAPRTSPLPFFGYGRSDTRKSDENEPAVSLELPMHTPYYEITPDGNYMERRPQYMRDNNAWRACTQQLEEAKRAYAVGDAPFPPIHGADGRNHLVSFWLSLHLMHREHLWFQLMRHQQCDVQGIRATLLQAPRLMNVFMVRQLANQQESIENIVKRVREDAYRAFAPWASRVTVLKRTNTGQSYFDVHGDVMMVFVPKADNTATPELVAKTREHNIAELGKQLVATYERDLDAILARVRAKEPKNALRTAILRRSTTVMRNDARAPLGDRMYFSFPYQCGLRTAVLIGGDAWLVGSQAPAGDGYLKGSLNSVRVLGAFYSARVNQQTTRGAAAATNEYAALMQSENDDGDVAMAALAAQLD